MLKFSSFMLLIQLLALSATAQSYTVQDSKGSSFSLQPNGSGGYTPTPIGKQGAPPKADYTLIQNTVATVTFEVENPEDKPFLDKFEGAYTSSLLMGERHLRIAYAERREGKQYYYAPVLSVNPGQSVTLRAKLSVEDENVHPDSIFFATKSGERLAAKRSGEYATLTLAAGTPKESRRYYALCPIGGNTLVVVGAVEVVTYPAKTVNVALVPVNDVGKGMSTAELEAYLNKAYAPANVRFKVAKEKSFDYNGNLKLLESGSGLLDAYTDDMQALNNAYVEQVGELKKDALYLFLMNYGGSADKHVAGFMPRQQQVGYIFLADAQENLYHTIAHELGHGTANLAHTFDKTKYGIAQGSTPNLMDYSGGTELVKLQWDALHNPGEVWKILERDKDAEYATDGHYYTVQLVALMMGLDKNIATYLARIAEQPDNTVLSSWNMKQRWTYLAPRLQQQYHTLTGRTHGVELALTSYAILKSHKDDKSGSKNYLLHRFGDCFGHSNTEETLFNENVLNDYVDAVDKYLAEVQPKVISLSEYKKLQNLTTDEYKDFEQYLFEYRIFYDGQYLITTLSQWEMIKKKIIEQLLYSYLHYNIPIESVQEQEARLEIENTHELWLRKTSIDIIQSRLPIGVSQNGYGMYGNNSHWTFGHFWSGSSPDYIGGRKELYLYYVEKLVELLNELYSKSIKGKTISAKFNTIVEFANANNSSNRLHELFAFEVAKSLTKNPKKIVFKVQNSNEQYADVLKIYVKEFYSTYECTHIKEKDCIRYEVVEKKK